MIKLLVRILKNNFFLHLFTNTFIFLNFVRKTGKGSKLSGFLKGMSFKSSIHILGDGNTVVLSKGYKLSKCKIYIKGTGNNIFIGKDCTLHRAVIWILGDNNSFIIGEDCRISNVEFGLERNGNSIELGRHVSLGGFVQLGMTRNNTDIIRLYTTESKGISIGDRTVVAEGAAFRTSDSHPIFDKEEKRINEADDISVGQRNWICSGASLLKGSKLGDESILGFKAVLTKDFSDHNNVLVAGIPAKIIKEDISWTLNL